MVRIPEGTFEHGLAENQAREALRLVTNSQPRPGDAQKLSPKGVREIVFVQAFDIDKYPVTNQQFAVFCAECNYPWPEQFLVRNKAYPDHPVVHLTWRDALCYALWAGKRLPGSLEWEKAARGATDGRRYPWGDEWDDDACNHNRHPSRETTPVTAFDDPRWNSPFGIVDMVGNAREWIASGCEPLTRGLRGGGWLERCALYGLVSNQVDAEVGFQDAATGFRCAADVVYDEVAISADAASAPQAAEAVPQRGAVG